MNPVSVYIVDDKKIIRDSLARTVEWEKHGFQLIGMSGDGVTAEEEIRRLQPQVIISDIRMPGQDGFELSRQISRYLPETKIIIITGFDKFEYAQNSLRIGAVDVILKPIKNEDLLTALEKARRQILRKNGQGNPDPGSSLPGLEESDCGHLTRAVILYMEQNLGSEISLSSLAEMYRVTPSHLSRIFKKETGVTFLRYLQNRRIEKAREMLTDPQFKIYEIAESCGFRSALHFSKIFKDTYTQTPRDYRRHRTGQKSKNHQ